MRWRVQSRAQQQRLGTHPDPKQTKFKMKLVGAQRLVVLLVVVAAAAAFRARWRSPVLLRLPIFL